MFTRRRLTVEFGMGGLFEDSEGRLITLEFEDFYLVNVYTPNSQRGLARLGYRLRWEEAFSSYLVSLDRKKPLVVCGDLNVAHNEIDLKNPDSNRNNAGFTEQERGVFGFAFKGVYRQFQALSRQNRAYTWWSYAFNAREQCRLAD